MEYMYELKDKLCKELDEIARKPEMGAGDLEIIHKLTDTIKILTRSICWKMTDIPKLGIAIEAALTIAAPAMPTAASTMSVATTAGMVILWKGAAIEVGTAATTPKRP